MSQHCVLPCKKTQRRGFFIDGVFAEFSTQNVSSLIAEFDNVIVIKSLSKVFGLPGLRVGWIESQKQNLGILRHGISPFRVPLVCQEIALAALRDTDHAARTLRFLSTEFNKIQQALGKNAVRKSNVPFFLFLTEHPQDTRQELVAKGISVVDSTSFSGAEQGFLRIAIGTAAQNKELVRALRQIKQRK